MPNPTLSADALFKDLRISSRIEAGDGFCAVMRSDLRALLAAFDAQDGEAERLRAALKTAHGELLEASDKFCVFGNNAPVKPLRAAEDGAHMRKLSGRMAASARALAALALPAPAQAEPVAPRTEHDPLVEQAEALLDLDAKKALVPYGVCGLARTIIERFIARARGASKPPDGFPIMAGDGSVFFVEDAAAPPPAGEG